MKRLKASAILEMRAVGFPDLMNRWGDEGTGPEEPCPGLSIWWQPVAVSEPCKTTLNIPEHYPTRN